MSELLREIEEDIRAERLNKLWHSFGRAMVAASVAVILATAVIVVVQNHRQQVAMEKTEQFIKGVDRMALEDYKGAIAAFNELTADKDSGYYRLAMLRRAQAEKGLGDKEAARKTYQALAGHDPVFGALAALAAGDPEFAPDRNSPFYYTQAEWKGWQLRQGGEKDKAAALLGSLSEDAAAPASLRQRLTQVTMNPEPVADEPKK